MKVVIRHKVGDINAWLAGHQDRVDLFAQVGSGFDTYQDADDPNSVVLVVETPDLEKLGSMVNAPENDAVKAKHTVLEPITMSMPIQL